MATKAKLGYGWLLKWIIAAILIGVGLTVFFQKMLVFLITGVFIVVFSIFRAVPLIRSLKREGVKVLSIIEIIVDTVLGALLIYVGARALYDSNFSPDNIWSIVYKYVLVFVLAARAIIFFYSVAFLKEKTEQIKFWAHIAVLVLASMIAVIPQFSETWISILILALCFLGSAYLVYDGYKGYGNYRKDSATILKERSAKKAKANPKEKPEEKDVPVVPVPEPEKEDHPSIMS